MTSDVVIMLWADPMEWQDHGKTGWATATGDESRGAFHKFAATCATTPLPAVCDQEARSVLLFPFHPTARGWPALALSVPGCLPRRGRRAGALQHEVDAQSTGRMKGSVRYDNHRRGWPVGRIRRQSGHSARPKTASRAVAPDYAADVARLGRSRVPSYHGIGGLADRRAQLRRRLPRRQE